MSKDERSNKWTDKSQVWIEYPIKMSWEKSDFHTFPVDAQIQWTEDLFSTYERQISWERLAQNIYLGQGINLLTPYRKHFLKNQVAQSYLSKNASIQWDKEHCETFGININWLINSKNKNIDPEFLQTQLIKFIKEKNEKLTLYYINEKYLLRNNAGQIIRYGLTKRDNISPGCSLLSNEIIRLMDNSKIRREYFLKDIDQAATIGNLTILAFSLLTPITP